MAVGTIEQLSLELEFLRMRVTSLEKSLDAAGIPIPKTRQQLANEAAAEDAAIRRGETRWE